jgi:integrase
MGETQDTGVGELAKKTVQQIGLVEPGVQEFLEGRRTSNRASLTKYAIYIGIARKRSEKPLLKLDVSEARKLSRRLKDEGLSPSILLQTKAFYVFHKMPDHAESFRTRMDMKRINPSDLPTVDDVNRLIAACDNLRDKALLAALAEGGMRIHELLAVRLRDVKILEKGGRKLVEMYLGKTKNREDHAVLLIQGAAHVLEWLKAYPKEIPGGSERPLFPSAQTKRYGKPMGKEGIRYILDSSSKRAGISKHLHAHLFRHAAATRLITKERLPDGLVKRALGWTEGSAMLARYSHLRNEDVFRARMEANGIEVEKAAAEAFNLVEPSGDLPAMPSPPPGTDMFSLQRAALLEEMEKLIEERVSPLVDEKVRETLQDRVGKLKRLKRATRIPASEVVTVMVGAKVFRKIRKV